MRRYSHFIKSVCLCQPMHRPCQYMSASDLISVSNASFYAPRRRYGITRSIHCWSPSFPSVHQSAQEQAPPPLLHVFFPSNAHDSRYNLTLTLEHDLPNIGLLPQPSPTMTGASRGRRRLFTALRVGSLIALFLVPPVHAIHHMKRAPVHYVPRQDDSRPLVVTNQCSEDIWPGIGTQAGTGPDTNGFQLSPGDTKSLEVSPNWQGRVWARTNCSFNDAGTGRADGTYGAACGTGDCGGVLDCKITVTISSLLCHVERFLTLCHRTGRNTRKPCRVHALHGEQSRLLRHLACRRLQHAACHHRPLPAVGRP